MWGGLSEAGSGLRMSMCGCGLKWKLERTRGNKGNDVLGVLQRIGRTLVVW